jgi:PAS domain S-box-containing protein
MVPPVRPSTVWQSLVPGAFRRRATGDCEAPAAALLDALEDGVVSADRRGIVTSCNAAAERLLGRSAAEAIGRPVRSWLATAEPGGADADAILARVLGGHTVRLHAAVDLEIACSPLRSRAADVVGLAMVIRDLGVLKQAERAAAEQRANVQSSLLELQRTNQELDEFVYVASHDLRSPLRAIGSLAQWIIDDDPAIHGKSAERLRVIQTRSRRMMGLLDGVMEYARASRATAPGGPPLPAAALVGEIAMTLQVPAGFRILADPSLEAVAVHRAPLEQVLHNLIGNAIKHHDRAQGTIRLWVADAGDHHRFAVADDGPGIPEAYRASVFEMFSTLKPRDELEGSGMGLALVRKIVSRLGGECGVQASAGRGTTLWFDWPKTPAVGAG